jgi:ubiquinone/menaquinone biosynthesis C-methylase UbiE
VTNYLNDLPDFNDPAVAFALDEASSWAHQFGTLIFDNLALLPNLQALDLGCGTGYPTFELAQRHGPSCHFVGVDIWQVALTRARQKLAAYRLPNVDFILLEGDRLRFPDCQFDLIVANLVLNNLENPQLTLAECARVAKPNARVAMTTNLVGHMYEFYTKYREVLIALDRSHYLERLEKNEQHRGTVESHCHVLEGAGFQIEKKIEATFSMRYSDGTALLNHFFVRLGFLPAWKAVVAPADETMVFRELERRLNEYARAHGELKLTIPMLYLEGKRR